MNNLDAFKDATAARLEPDRAARWLSYWDTFSSTIPDEVTDAEYSDLVLGTWIDFRELDHGEQVAAISRAWNIQRLQKARPKTKAQPPAIVVKHVEPWSPCVHWGGTRPCSEHGEFIPYHAQRMKQAQDMWERHARFVRKRLYAEIMPRTNGARYEHFDDIESEVWFNVARRMETYAPMLNPETGREMPLAWLRSIVHTTVADFFTHRIAQKRDVRREVPLPTYSGDRGIPNPDCPPPACPTPTAEIRNLMRENEFEGD